MKEICIEITRDIIAEDIPDELAVYDLFSDSLYDQAKLFNNRDDYSDDSFFGEQNDLIAQIVMALVVSVASDMVKAGAELTRKKIAEWYEKNKAAVEKKELALKKTVVLSKLIEKHLNK